MFQNIEELEKQVKEFRQNILASSEFIKGIRNLTNMVEIQQTEFDKDSKEVLATIVTYTQYVKEQSDLLINSITEQASKEADSFAKSNEELITKLKTDSEELSSLITEKVDNHLKSNTDLTSKFTTISETLVKSVTDKTNATIREIIDSNSGLITGFENRLAEHEKNLGLLLDRIKADNVKVSEETIAAFRDINQDYAKKLDDESALLRKLIFQLEGKYNQFTEKLERSNVDRLSTDLQEMKKSINSKFALLFAGVGVATILIIISFFIK